MKQPKNPMRSKNLAPKRYLNIVDEIFKVILALIESLGQSTFLFENRDCLECNQKARDILGADKTKLLPEGPFSAQALRRAEGAHQAISDQLLSSIAKKILPYIETMSSCPYGPACHANCQITQRDLSSLPKPCPHAHPVVVNRLSPTEAKIADLIRQGMGTKEIAHHLRLAPNSVSWHRARIRKKLSLVGTKSNLRAFLADR